MASGDSQPQPFLTVSRRSDSVTSASPSTHEHSPVQPRSPDLHSADVCAQDNSLHQDGHPMLDEQYIKVCVNITVTYNSVSTIMGVACCYGNVGMYQIYL